ncbi:MAG: SEL1-like repeat protein [Bacteroidetes bacterium]|nr:SEL1-like repeat protein [Bacteroidota bacterium]
MAQYKLGHMYARGEGVPKNYVEAYAWSSLSASQGNVDATELKDSLLSAMTSAQVAEAKKRSYEIFGRIESGNLQQ